jgi:geranylgeranyl pyrophosphate synthase
MQRITSDPPTDNFSTKIDSYRVQVDIALQKELSQRRESPFFAPFKDAFTGGKRLRPILLLIAYDSVRARDDEPLPAAVAVELAHMESLITTTLSMEMKYDATPRRFTRSMAKRWRF